MRESRTYGFVRGARGNSRPYRVRADGSLWHLATVRCAHQSLEFSSDFGEDRTWTDALR